MIMYETQSDSGFPGVLLLINSNPIGNIGQSIAEQYHEHNSFRPASYYYAIMLTARNGHKQ